MLRKFFEDFFVAFGLLIFIAWYSWDNYTAASSLENNIFVLPIAVVAMLLCLVEGIKSFITVKKSQTETNKDEKSDNSEKSDTLAVLKVLAVFSVYVLTLPYLGFDLGTIIFVAVFLYTNKEKSIGLILSYSIVYGLILAWFFSFMLPYPIPMTFLPTEY